MSARRLDGYTRSTGPNVGDYMNKHFLAPVAVAAATLGLVGGVAYAGSVAFAPVKHEQAKVQFVVPAAVTVTPTPVATPAVVAPKPVARKVAPKPAPVQSVQAKAPAPAPVQRQAVVSEPAPNPAPVPDATPPARSAYDAMEQKKKQDPPPPTP